MVRRPGSISAPPFGHALLARRRSILRHRIGLGAAWEPPGPGADAWSRRFGRPLDLPDGERLVLVIAAGAPGDGAPGGPTLHGTTLNGLPLDRLPAASSLAAFPGAAVLARDVGGILGPRNILRLTLPAPADRPARADLPEALARVWLEVQSDATADDEADRGAGPGHR